MLTTILFAVLAFIVYVRSCNNNLISLIDNTKRWCEKEVSTALLDEDPDEWKELHNDEIPLFDDWSLWLNKIRALVDSAIMVNVILLFWAYVGPIFEETPYILNMIVACFDATVIIAWLDIREKQEYIKQLREHYHELIDPKEIESDIL